jgi:hypothetical protein
VVYGIAAAGIVFAGVTYPDAAIFALLAVGLIGFDFWRRLIRNS